MPVPDLNAAGFKEYKKGNYQKAIELFEKAREVTPNNAYAWFNWGRTHALLNHQSERTPCEPENDWVMLSLASIQRAVDLDRTNIMARIAEDEPGLAPLEKTPQFSNWLLAQQPLPADDAALRKFLEGHGSWWRSEGNMAEFLTLLQNGAVEITKALGGAVTQPAGRWEAKGGRVQMTDKAARNYALKKNGWYFDQGRKRIDILYLTSRDGPVEAWQLGPIDCDM